jgi:methylmalonyl-CoA mutase N-terminal domain/subunit
MSRHLSDRTGPPRQKFVTVSDMEIDALYGPESRDGWDPARDLGRPGEFPYTRGVYPTMYRGKLWTMRQFAGFGTPEDTNRRFKVLLAEGQGGLSTAFDMPTLMGYDPDHPRARGEVGREGVSVATLADMEALFGDLPLEQVTTSMTVNCTASIVLAMYLAVAERQGADWRKVGGTIQNDMLKEFIAQKEWICPPGPAVRIVVDMIEFCAERAPKWHPVSVSGYHIREAGATAVQELAFTLADGIGYVQACVDRGMPVDAFAPRLSFFFDVHNDFFEEIAKFRAARRMWARIMRDRFGATDPRAMLLRTHAQTAGVSLTAQQPMNNAARVAIQGLAAVLGGTQSLHTNAIDETLALPTEETARLALRTQQIIAYESGVANTVDPLGGSYFVEALTDRMEREATAYIERIDRMGGIVRAIEEGYPQREIADSAYRFQQAVERGEQVIVGVNRFVQAEDEPIPLLKVDDAVERRQAERLAEVKARRDAALVRRRLDDLRQACEARGNLMPPLLDAVKAYATVGEISDVYRTAFGEYRDPGHF